MLPEVLPMLAVPAQPFDCAGHCFEVKWDGVRALAAVDEKRWRIWGRDRSDYAPRYPELSVLRALPPGTLVDGELITLREGLPHLAKLLQRHFLSNPWKIRQAASWCPAHYVLFDLLYLEGHCLMREPLARRREALEALCRDAALPGVIFSAGVVGAGNAFYEAVVAQGHEGVVAKLLLSPYRPGARWAAWKKIKPPGRGRRR
jgi:bifunctional non-homologous end joining protein LigD